VHLGPLALASVLVATVAGSTVQGTIGFGVNLVVVPVLAIVEPKALPATTVLLAIPLTLGMVAREHRHIDWRGVTWLSAGHVPGAVVGAVLVSVVSTHALALMVGVTVLVAVATSWLSPPIPITPATATTVGFASGVMGTASSIGGPPVALLYQHHEGPVLRSSQAAKFAIGTVISLAALAVAGAVHLWHVALAGVLVPAVGAGLVLSRLLHRWIDGPWLRPAILLFAAGAAAFTVARAVA
jgi:uncharacterized membrane protein YfcA